MGKTLSEKIIARAAGRESVVPDEIVTVEVDVAMIHDSGGPRRYWDTMREMDVGVWDPSKLVVIADHYVPAKDVAAAEILQLTREFVEFYDIPRFHEAEGIAHTVMIEKGYVRPGMLYVGGDSHSLTGGAVGSFTVGMGSTDMLGVVTTGETWLRVPHTIRVVLDGALPRGVAAKDLILTMIGDHTMAGGLYKSLEFHGSGIAAMGIEERSVLSNMCAEIGAKAGIVPADDVTRAYFAERGIDVEPPYPASDPDASFSETWTYRGQEIEPVVARPHRHDDVVPVSSETGTSIDRAYIGACTGAKYEDLAMAAEVLRGRTVAQGVLLQVAPASRAALQKAMETGVAAVLMEAGAHILPTGCGACPGIGTGILGPGEVCISTTSRNAKGRMGSPDSEVYLASPYGVAAAAVAGRIVDPRDLLQEVAA
ncbi:MAG: aconitase/3-isopropylmalate dehydratase large subunit family protein [Acidimicrobiia bacterium]|nr:aconitase/3-isopropylmalate dehydratase large subunit family protein [Acidimicrobiia bacterium]